MHGKRDAVLLHITLAVNTDNCLLPCDVGFGSLADRDWFTLHTFCRSFRNCKNSGNDITFLVHCLLPNFAMAYQEITLINSVTTWGSPGRAEGLVPHVRH